MSQVHRILQNQSQKREPHGESIGDTTSGKTVLPSICQDDLQNPISSDTLQQYYNASVPCTIYNSSDTWMPDPKSSQSNRPTLTELYGWGNSLVSSFISNRPWGLYMTGAGLVSNEGTSGTSELAIYRAEVWIGGFSTTPKLQLPAYRSIGCIYIIQGTIQEGTDTPRAAQEDLKHELPAAEMWDVSYCTYKTHKDEWRAHMGSGHWCKFTAMHGWFIPEGS